MTSLQEAPDAVPARRLPDPIDFGHRTVALRRGGVAVRWRVRTAATCGVLAVLTVAVTVAALALGDYTLTPLEVLAALRGDADAGFARVVVVEWRLPRAVAAVVFGAALGASGAVVQSLMRNPLASPDVVGFSAGSYTGALVVIVLLGGSYLQLAAGALVGGLATAAAVYLVAWRRGVQGFRLIVVGIAVAAMLTSVNTWLILTAELEVAISASAWGVGSLTGTGWEPVAVGGVLVVVLLGVLAALSTGLRQLELGDDAARATGARPEPLRLGLLVVAVGLTAIVTAAAGPIAFISLAAPQVALRVVRTAGVTVVPSALVGALLLAAADVVSQHLLPVPLPVGVVTVVVGGAHLVWLVARQIRTRA